MAGLAFDPAAALAHLRAADPVLGSLIDKAGPFTLRPRRSLETFDALLQSIVYQQLNGKAAETILGRFQALYTAKRPLTPANLLKTPAGLMRGAGLSGSKTLALKDLAAKTLAGVVPPLREARRLSDAQLVERLTAVRGIGPWTVHMLLIFRLGRPDVLPTGDFAIRKAFGRAYRKRVMPTPEQLERHGERWRPFRTVAAWYLWRTLD